MKPSTPTLPWGQRPRTPQPDIGKQMPTEPPHFVRQPTETSDGPIPLSTQIENHNHHLHATAFVSINGSLEEFAQDPSKASWTIQNADGFRDASKKGDITRAILISATAEMVNNNFPVPVGITIPGTPQDEICGDFSCNFAVGPNSSGTKGGVIVRNRKTLDSKIVAYFAEKTPDEIKSQFQSVQLTENSVDPISNKPQTKIHDCYLIPQDNPIIPLIKSNAAALGIRHTIEPFATGYYAIEKSLADRMVDDIEQNVIRKISFFDFSKLTAFIARTDGRKWSDAEGVNGISPGDIAYLTQSSCLSLKITFKYVLVGA